MNHLISTAGFKKLNVGFALDEGYANPSEEFHLFYGERQGYCEYGCIGL